MQGSQPERLVSGSDDFTLFLWNPAEGKKHIARMTGELDKALCTCIQSLRGNQLTCCLLSGHQQLINQVCYSPNGRTIASASFDKSVKLWDGKTGRYNRN
jgi:ribosome assembly protein 4